MINYSEKRKVITEYGKKYNIGEFVETGSFLGDTADTMKKHFRKVFTIELQPELAAGCMERFRNDPNVMVYQGNSSEVLTEIMNKLESETLFWLDAHYSSEFQLGNQYIKTARGDKSTPIVQELAIILKDGLKQNVILIDDARLFIGKNDYPSLKELKKFLNNKGIQNKQIAVRNDIIQITP